MFANLSSLISNLSSLQSEGWAYSVCRKIHWDQIPPGACCVLGAGKLLLHWRSRHRPITCVEGAQFRGGTSKVLGVATQRRVVPTEISRLQNQSFCYCCKEEFHRHRTQKKPISCYFCNSQRKWCASSQSKKKNYDKQQQPICILLCVLNLQSESPMCLGHDLENCKIIHIFLFQAFNLYRKWRRQCVSGSRW